MDQEGGEGRLGGVSRRRCRGTGREIGCPSKAGGGQASDIRTDGMEQEAAGTMVAAPKRLCCPHP